MKWMGFFIFLFSMAGLDARASEFCEDGSSTFYRVNEIRVNMGLSWSNEFLQVYTTPEHATGITGTEITEITPTRATARIVESPYFKVYVGDVLEVCDTGIPVPDGFYGDPYKMRPIQSANPDKVDLGATNRVGYVVGLWISENLEVTEISGH